MWILTVLRRALVVILIVTIIVCFSYDLKGTVDYETKHKNDVTIENVTNYEYTVDSSARSHHSSNDNTLMKCKSSWFWGIEPVESTGFHVYKYKIDTKKKKIYFFANKRYSCEELKGCVYEIENHQYLCNDDVECAFEYLVIDYGNNNEFIVYSTIEEIPTSLQDEFNDPVGWQVYAKFLEKN